MPAEKNDSRKHMSSYLTKSLLRSLKASLKREEEDEHSQRITKPKTKSSNTNDK